jgi:hypothetical protein
MYRRQAENIEEDGFDPVGVIIDLMKARMQDATGLFFIGKN